MLENDFSFAYSEDHHEEFGLFPGTDRLPDHDQGNQELMSLFEEKLDDGRDAR